MSIEHGVHATEIRVRYAETDQMGVAYNAHYLAWFEVGRTEFLREMGVTYRAVEERGWMLPLTGAGVEFLKPARYDDVLTVRTRILAKPGVRLKLGYEVEREGVLVATGHTDHVFTDPRLAPVRPGRDILTLLEACWAESSAGGEAP